MRRQWLLVRLIQLVSMQAEFVDDMSGSERGEKEMRRQWLTGPPSSGCEAVAPATGCGTSQA